MFTDNQERAALMALMFAALYYVSPNVWFSIISFILTVIFAGVAIQDRNGKE